MKNSICLILVIIVITCNMSLAQSWTVTGDTVSTTGTAKAANLNISGNIFSPSGILGFGSAAYPNAVTMAIQTYTVDCGGVIFNSCWGYEFEGSTTPSITAVGIGTSSIISPKAELEIEGSTGGFPGLVVGAGNVGIGTTTPSAQLTIKMPASPSSLAFSVTNSSGGNIFNVDNSGNINAAGNILIQTTNNEYALNVGGTIWSHEVQVCMSGCDFVFEKDYKLMPLNDLENYLQLNHHLPGIAAAKEMETSNGVALGKMNSQLLQKVEELTLYLIQLQKQLEEQNEKIKDLQNTVSSLQKK